MATKHSIVEEAAPLKVAQVHRSQLKWCQELVCAVAFAALEIYCWSTHGSLALPLWQYAAVYAGALLLADFGSGIVHWGCDTWGSSSTPLVGHMIQCFREHHAFPQRILEHDFLERNGDSCMIGVAVLLLTCFGVPQLLAPAVHMMVALALALVAVTNDAHMWAHYKANRAAIPSYVRFFQKAYIYTSIDAHALHHRGMHDSDYCILNGLANPALEAIDFWRRTERLITAITGLEPRANDPHLMSLKEKMAELRAHNKQQTAN